MKPYLPSWKSLALTLALTLGLAACGAPGDNTGINDPFEPLNRGTHAVNKGADRLFFRPASQVYGTVAPKPVRTGLSNAASNLNGPRTVANNILQGNIDDAGHNFVRFLINSTLGVFGFFDPAASDFGLEDRSSGFGDTLALWGAGEGPYVEMPLLGPSTGRDAIGQIVDIATNPASAFGDESDEIAAATSLPSALNSRYEYTDTLDSVLYESADSYAQLRLYYLESRRFQLSGQTSAENAFDPYENLYDEVYEDLYEDF